MSDGFDKEAEREKLREKLADDEKKREHTQRMSELLLKGATMTNRHCEACGDPIFRHDGREFCPTCGDGTADENETGGEPPAAANGAVEPAVDAANTAAEGGGVGRADDGGADAAAAGGESRSAASSRRSEPERSGSSRQRASRRPDSRRSESRSVPRQSADDAEGIDAARASLTRTLTRFARAAEEADDPRRARDRLAAAREAAEALAALD